jgi:type I restriction enzyme S subunit
MLAEASKSAPSDWVIQPIESVCSRVTSGGTPSRRLPEYFIDGKWGWIKSQELLDRWIEDTEEHITDEAIENSSAKVLPINTVLIAMYGATVGQLGILHHPMTCNQACCAFIIDKNKADFQYLFYQLLAHREQLKSASVGAAQQNLSGQVLKRFELPFPSISEQHAIAGILSALDDKIEVNRRMNTTLESLARVVFRHWFVRNKEIEKWKIGRLGDLIQINAQSISKDYPNSEIEYIDISSVSIGHLENTASYSLNDAPSRAKRLVKHGDTIWSTVRPNRKSYLFISNPIDNLVVSTGFAVLTPTNIPPSFLYFWVTTDEFVDYLVSNADGSAYPAVLPERFAEAEIPLPPKDFLDKFENFIGVMLDRIAHNEKESRTLASLRDSLLPKLMRGEVHVEDLKK